MSLVGSLLGVHLYETVEAFLLLEKRIRGRLFSCFLKREV